MVRLSGVSISLSRLSITPPHDGHRVGKRPVPSGTSSRLRKQSPQTIRTAAFIATVLPSQPFRHRNTSEVSGTIKRQPRTNRSALPGKS